MCSLATRYSTEVFSRLERVPCLNLFIVERGVVAKRGALGVAGTCFGQDVILSNDNLRDIGDAIALTFVQTTELNQSDIFALLPEYPKAYHIVRRAALQMALLRVLTKAVRIVQRSEGGQMGFDQASEAARDERDVFAVLETAALEPLHPNEPVPVADKAAPIFFPVSLKKTLHSFKKRADGKAGAIEGAVGLWGNRPHIGKVPTQEERMVDLQAQMEQSHESTTSRLTRLEVLMTKLVDGQRRQRSNVGGGGGGSFQLRRRASKGNDLMNGAEKNGMATTNVLSAAQQHAQQERAELRAEAALGANPASTSSPFEA